MRGVTALPPVPFLSHPQGFVAAVSPFNFTAIGGNLAGAPALMVSVVVGFWENQGWRGQCGERLGGGPGFSEAVVCLVWDPQGANSASPVLFNRTHLGSCLCWSP